MQRQLSGQHPYDWEQATQHYLAINALQRSLPVSEQRRDGMMRLREMLNLRGKKVAAAE